MLDQAKKYSHLEEAFTEDPLVEPIVVGPNKERFLEWWEIYH